MQFKGGGVAAHNGLEMSRPASSSIVSKTRFAAAGRVGSIELLGGPTSLCVWEESARSRVVGPVTTFLIFEDEAVRSLPDNTGKAWRRRGKDDLWAEVVDIHDHKVCEAKRAVFLAKQVGNRLARR